MSEEKIEKLCFDIIDLIDDSELELEDIILVLRLVTIAEIATKADETLKGEQA